MNADGSVVVGSGTFPTGQGAFRWTSAGVVFLGTLPGSLGCGASAVSGDGTVIVGACSYPTYDQAFRWTAAGGMVGLNISQGTGISADGQVIVGTNGPYMFNARAMRWTSAGGVQNLGTLPGDRASFGFAANADGSVVVALSGDFMEYNEYNRAFRWTSDGMGSGIMESLGTLPGGTHAGAAGVSADGAVVVGQSETDGYNPHAFRWTHDSGMVDLGALPGGMYSFSYANAVSSDGAVIVGDNYSSDGFRALLWRDDLGIVDLNTYLPSLGINLTGWRLQSANAISADGRVIVGRGTHSGNTEGWIAALAPPCPADFNHSGAVNSQDFFDFLSAYFALDPSADFNHSGAIDSQDFFDFLAAFAAGC